MLPNFSYILAHTNVVTSAAHCGKAPCGRDPNHSQAPRGFWRAEVIKILDAPAAHSQAAH